MIIFLNLLIFYFTYHLKSKTELINSYKNLLIRAITYKIEYILHVFI